MNSKQWLAVALLAGTTSLTPACDGETEGTGGMGGMGGTGGTGGAPPTPVACDELAGDIPSDGDACATPGDLCDIPGGTCLFQCGDDRVWHASCWTCPANRPAQDDACDPKTNSGDCSYPPVAMCGPGSGTTFTCHAMTSAWQEVDAQPCP